MSAFLSYRPKKAVLRKDVDKRGKAVLVIIERTELLTARTPHVAYVVG